MSAIVSDVMFIGWGPFVVCLLRSVFAGQAETLWCTSHFTSPLRGGRNLRAWRSKFRVGVMADRRARYLRAHTTDAERLLWPGLRLLKFKGLHFRRQAPIGPYCVDFVCHSAKLVVELDGSCHAEPAQVSHDIARTEFLRLKGYRVLRFWNGEVFKERAGVLDSILATALRPPPEIRSRESRSQISTSPQGGGEIK
jgi:very-short-patch-repair endonuclease